MIKFTIGNSHTTISFPLHERDNIGAILQKFLTVDVPGAKFLWAYKSGQWDGKVRLFEQPDLTSFRILTGLYPEAVAAIEQNGYTWEFEDNRGIQNPQLKPYNLKLHPYQHEVLSGAFSALAAGVGWWPRGIVHVATGGGKTEIAVAMYQTYPVETIFLVHRKDLLIQAQERFEKYGVKVGVIGANLFKPVANGVNIMTVQTLLSIAEAKDERLPKLVQLMFDAKQLFFDEAHIMAASQDKGNQFVEIMNWFPNAHARWGLTATPFIRGQYDNLLLEGATGKVLASVPTEWLVQNGYLVQPNVKMIKVPGKLPLVSNWKSSNKAKAEYYRKVESKGIINNSWRNQRIAQEIIAGPFPLICMVKTIEQANQIQQYTQNVPVLTGTSSAAERRKIVNLLRTGQLKALIVTTIWDEGVDIPELLKVILGSGGKSHVKLLQRLGRGLRTAAGKTSVEIIDFGDQHANLLENHAKIRKKFYKDEGFNVQEIA